MASPSQTVTPDTLWEALDKALPERFPTDFMWECECDEKGFPGCNKIPCFLDRVNLALLHYHQLQETAYRGEKVIYRQGLGRLEPVAIDPTNFPRKRRKLYDADVTLTIQTLEAHGLKRVL